MSGRETWPDLARTGGGDPRVDRRFPTARLGVESDSDHDRRDSQEGDWHYEKNRDALE